MKKACAVFLVSPAFLKKSFDLVAFIRYQYVRFVAGACLFMGACAISGILAAQTWAAGGDVLWQEEFVRTNFHDVNGMAVEGKRLYVAVGGEAYLVRAYDGKTGALLWQDEPFVANNTTSANSIAADNGRVYVAGRKGGDLLVRAYNGKSGKLLWQDIFDLAGKDDFAQKITVEKGHVYVGGVGTIRQARPGAPGNALLVVRTYDAQDGKILWQDLFDVTAETQSNGVTTLAAKKGRLYVAGGRNNGAMVRAYDGDTGILLWQNEEAMSGFTAIEAAHGQVYASGYRRSGSIGLFFVRTYDGDTGAIVWQDQYSLSGMEDSGSASISITGKRLYAVGYGTSGIIPSAGVMYDYLVRAYDRQSGILLWQDNFHGVGYRTNVAMSVDSGEPAASPDDTVDGKGVYVAGFTTTSALDTAFVVRAYEGKSGVLLWKDDLLRPGLDAAFAIAAENGRAYAAGYVAADTAGHLLIRAYDTR